MMEFEKQSEIMDMKEEMMEDAIDDAMGDEEDEEEGDKIVQQVLDELGLDLGDKLNGKNAFMGKLLATNCCPKKFTAYRFAFTFVIPNSYYPFPPIYFSTLYPTVSPLSHGLSPLCRPTYGQGQHGDAGRRHGGQDSRRRRRSG